MVKYFVNKLFYSISVLIGVIFIIFGIFNFLPVDPARLTLGQRADVESVAAIQKELGLDKPKIVQFAYYLNDISPISINENTTEAQEKYGYVKLFPVSKNNALVVKLPYLRRSYQTKENVSKILLDSLPSTFILATSSILLAILIGVLLGIIAAVKQHSWLDTIAMNLSVVGISIPAYLSAMIFSYYFGYVWHNITGLEASGDLKYIDDFGNDVLSLKNLILPTIALGTRPIAIIFQLTRSSMLDILSQDYIRTAKAKGLSDKVVLFKHALRNSLNPVITSVSGWFASLLAGAFFIERVFNIHGLGLTTIDALQKFDLPVVMGSVLFSASIFILMSILVDVLYAVVDPRIRVK